MHALRDRVDVQQGDADDRLLELEQPDAQTSGDMLDAELPWSSGFDGFRDFGWGDSSWWDRATEWALS